MRPIHVNCTNSLGFDMAEDYADLINNMLTVYHRMICLLKCSSYIRISVFPNVFEYCKQ